VLILEDLDKKNAWNVELTAGVAPAHASASATGPAPRQHHQTTTDDGAGDGGVEGGNDTSGPSSFRASQLSFDMPSDRSDISAVMPLRVFQYVMSTREPCVLNDVLILPAGSPLSALASDPWFQRHRPRSALACPIFKLGRVVGLLYLEQAHHARAFNHASVQLLHLLCSQAALSLDNSRIHARLQSSHAALERQVHSRMLELHARNAQLEKEVATRQQAEEEMRAAKEEAVRAGNSKSTFLATMSHELRTPLNAVLGLARLLLATELTDEQESYLVMMTNSSHLLLTLVADVLDYSVS
jgi:GAF domain-containing protein